jgi:hypothetical protein
MPSLANRYGFRTPAEFLDLPLGLQRQYMLQLADFPPLGGVIQYTKGGD